LKDKIFWFDISVDESKIVDDFKTFNCLSYYPRSRALADPRMLFDQRIDLLSCGELSQNKEILLIAKVPIKRYNVNMP
jgi:hypothetical protein